MSEATNAERWVPSHCSMCYHGCPIVAHVRDGVLVKIEGNPATPATRGRLCPKGNAGIMRLYDPKRLKKPMRRTNPRKDLGVDPGWEEISWDEAMTILETKLRDIRARNPNLLALGGFNTHSWHWGNAFGLSFGTQNTLKNLFSAMGHMCGNGAHTAGEMIHNSMNTHPDMEHAEYVIVAGAALGEAFQSAVAYGRILGDAKARKNFKMVVVDPQQSRAAAMADEWVPIRPATDGALFMAIMNVLVHEAGIYDEHYLRVHTNGGYLIGQDGYFLRDAESGKPLVWDARSNQARAYDDPALSVDDIALLGTFRTDVGEGRPGFQLLHDHLRAYTPEWAEVITSVPAATIRRLANELGQAAHIGETIEIDGKTYPYRPVSVSGYRGVSTHTNAMHTCWAMELINVLLGSTRAVGGARAWIGTMMPSSPSATLPGPDGLIFTPFQPHAFSFPPKMSSLPEYFPVAFDAGLLCFETQVHPDQFGNTPIEMLIYEGGNPVLTGQNPASAIAGLKAIPYMVDITLYVDETAEFADLLLPDVTYLERWAWEGMWSVEDEGIQIQQPVVEPLHGIPHSADIYIELANRLGFMTGPLGFSSFLNMMQMTGGATEAVSKAAVNDINHVYRSAREYVACYVKAMAPDEEALVWQQGHNLKPKLAWKRYVPGCFDGHRIPLYSTWFKQIGDTLRQNMSASEVFAKAPGLDPERVFFEYAPLPFWHPSVIEEEPSEYDMYVINWRTAMAGVGSGTVPATNVWLLEAAERDPYLSRILINSATARNKKLADGQRVHVESPHGRIEGVLKCTETIHPEVLGTIGCWGHYTDAAIAKGRGPGNFNSLLGRGLRYMGPSTLQAECTARVRIRAV
ncbi:MAG: molybdopterin-dependent oxidoreductase [Rhodocyclaceae bacterium]|nr:molybdopterin-dependent oxidoreductase [Rhodocyclaceae bacterium]MBK9310568.1 molybdopterin-dependent oxidoreductase [Rhodocyclaceae bacterium]MBK9954361.1 molybdopterin-dependent oxidoreductase [Rhodocyclaceae bacterium]